MHATYLVLCSNKQHENKEKEKKVRPFLKAAQVNSIHKEIVFIERKSLGFDTKDLPVSMRLGFE